MPRFLRNYLARHQHPANLGLHLVGVPVTFVVPVVILIEAPRAWSWAAAAFVAGYLLQWIGHVIEGNDMGEVVLVKKLLGKPYVAIAPRRGDQSVTPDSPPRP
ncbi:MAG: Mpo1-like protein [Planctomycetales bacterium]